MATKPSDRSPGPVHVAATATAPVFFAFGVEWRALAGSSHTAGTYNLFEASMPAGSKLGPWVHAQDEAFFILEGAADLFLEDRILPVRAGSFAFVPANTASGVRASIDARILVFHFPGGLDRAIAAGDGGVDDRRSHEALAGMGTRLIAAPAGW